MASRILTEAGKLVHALDLPERGHDITFDPVSRRSVVFARQPGTFAVVFDHTGEAEPVTIASVEGRHFYGHGVFSPDGALLYATENDFDNAAGMIGVYDATDGFRRIGEFATHGVGPHELLLCPDGKTLAIANGGIETHPDYRPRQAQHRDDAAVPGIRRSRQRRAQGEARARPGAAPALHPPYGLRRRRHTVVRLPAQGAG